MYVKDFMIPFWRTYEPKSFCSIDGAAQKDDSGGGDGSSDAGVGGSNDTGNNNDSGADGGGGDSGNVIRPENWREEFAGGDEKKLKRMGRFTEPGALLDSYLELEQTHKNADIRSPFPEEGTDEEKGSWREQNKIPSEAAGYLEGLPEGLDLTDWDKDGVDGLVNAMHGVNASPAATHAALGAYRDHQDAKNSQQADQDVLDRKARDDVLNVDMGKEYRRNMDDLERWAEKSSMTDLVLNARGPDGSYVANNPDYIKALVGLMREGDPIHTIPNLGDGDPSASLDTAIAEIEKVIKNDNKTYTNDKAMNARYLELLEARDKRK